MRHPYCALALFSLLAAANQAPAACCYFSARNTDILQPAQKVFITWDPAEKTETFTVQPKFEGNALDFGMVIPTPSRPKLHEMPRDFFKHLAVYTIMKRRAFVQSKVLEVIDADQAAQNPMKKTNEEIAKVNQPGKPSDPKSTVRVLEHGIVGSLDYKIIEAGKAHDLYQWLKDNKYQYSGDQATLQHYVQRKWLFTVMKIDTMQMKRNKDGTFAGDVSPTRFQFASDKIVYPLKITQISVRDKTEALFYVQAPYKVDLPGDMTYQYTWTPMLQAASGCTPGGLPGRGDEWLASYKDHIPALLKRAQELGFAFVSGQRPGPNAKGHIPTTMEWARKLTKDDIAILQGKAPYCEKVPDVDDGFDLNEVQQLVQNNSNNNSNIQLNFQQQVIQGGFNNYQNNARVNAIGNVVRNRVAKYNKDRPFGYLVREAPSDDVKNLAQLAGHLCEDGFITKFRKIFARDEMNDDLLIIPARYQGAEDRSEYEEMLPTSPP